MDVVLQTGHQSVAGRLVEYFELSRSDGAAELGGLFPPGFAEEVRVIIETRSYSATFRMDKSSTPCSLPACAPNTWRLVTATRPNRRRRRLK